MTVKIEFGKTFNKIAEDILPIFGIKANVRQRGGVRLPGHDVMVWWPNPFNQTKWIDERIAARDGVDYPIITEQNADPVENLAYMEDVIRHEPHTRFVFWREKWFSPRVMRFCGSSWLRAYGVYELDVDASRAEKKLIWRRTAKDIEVDIQGLKAAA